MQVIAYDAAGNEVARRTLKADCSAFVVSLVEVDLRKNKAVARVEVQK